jgi:hypothetical protein
VKNIKKIRDGQMEHTLQAKMYGGLGILNLEVQNSCLHSKWLLKLVNEEGLWQEVLKKNI